jgi:hypothetical protein
LSCSRLLTCARWPGPTASGFLHDVSPGLLGCSPLLTCARSPGLTDSEFPGYVFSLVIPC